MRLLHRFLLLLHTLRYLKAEQLIFQIIRRLQKRTLPKGSHFLISSKIKVEFKELPISKYNSVCSDSFCFLNIEDRFYSWDDLRHGLLWAYNLNYFDWLLQPNLRMEVGVKWIERYISDIAKVRIGMNPYPISLRGMNWIKFMCIHKDSLPVDRVVRWKRVLRQQYALLERSTERHLLGNHLLENACSLYMAGIFFSDFRVWRHAKGLLQREMAKQILEDGAHYEQSPMYHCILLDRLLDVYNFSVANNKFGEEQLLFDLVLNDKAKRMLGHLSGILYADGSFPLFNDSAFGIAPAPKSIFDYALRLGIVWNPLPLGSCGYRKLLAGEFEAFIDAGGVAASYQPGHSHADALNFELRIGGLPFIIDTGISTYEKTERRQYERGTSAHNTVMIEGVDSAEVWGGFRMGRRSKVKIEKDVSNKVIACQSGIRKGMRHRRAFEITSQCFRITDHIEFSKSGKSYLHFAPEIEIISCSDFEVITSRAIIRINGATHISLRDDYASDSYNILRPIKVVEMSFQGSMEVMVVLESFNV